MNGRRGSGCKGWGSIPWPVATARAPDVGTPLAIAFLLSMWCVQSFGFVSPINCFSFSGNTDVSPMTRTRRPAGGQLSGETHVSEPWVEAQGVAASSTLADPKPFSSTGG